MARGLQRQQVFQPSERLHDLRRQCRKSFVLPFFDGSEAATTNSSECACFQEVEQAVQLSCSSRRQADITRQSNDVERFGNQGRSGPEGNKSLLGTRQVMVQAKVISPGRLDVGSEKKWSCKSLITLR